MHIDLRQVTESNSVLNQELAESKVDLKALKKINDELEAKVEASEIEINRHQKETEKKISIKDEENKMLKNSIKSCTSEKVNSRIFKRL